MSIPPVAPPQPRPILVVGGAGYIGSHMLLALREAGWNTCVVDDMRNGHHQALLGAPLEQGDIGDPGFVRELLARVQPLAVMHFASLIQVGESMAQPARYYRNNVAASLTLLEAMVDAGIRHLVFSSTAAIFGEPRYSPIDEAHPREPINPYGRGKAMVEDMLADFDAAYGLQSVCLRYFNAAGADPLARVGECHQPETHLIPLLLQVASGQRESIRIFGDDYPTADGSCVRDYIHVSDLCQAHLRALDWLLAGRGSARFNLGNGTGHSVQEVLQAARRITGHPIPAIIEPRRPGDPAVLVADARQARERLGWQPRHAGLDTIIAHAWTWECKRAGRMPG
ncbi:UDP-glucose 4-epimerase GalE [Luteimonas sp. e5]